MNDVRILTVPDMCEDDGEELYARIFLAGSIEMGKAEDWQTQMICDIQNDFNDDRIIIMNPRREEWDSSWKQDPVSGPFNEQVIWELSHLKYSNIIIFNFQGDTISPVTLLELGLFLQDETKTKFIICPKEFHRYGNVRLTTEMLGVNCRFYHEYDENCLDDIIMAIDRKISFDE